MTFVDFVVAVDSRLSGAGIAHAFGGALALAYVADPRGTVDVDVNVFTPLDRIDVVLDALSTLGLHPERPRPTWLPAAGIRLRADVVPYPVDLFPSIDDRYAEVERRVERHPFGPGEALLPFLSAEDLAVFKLSFGRDKDWVDLRSIAASRPDLDVDYVERQLVGLRGPGMYSRVVRLSQMLRRPEP